VDRYVFRLPLSPYRRASATTRPAQLTGTSRGGPGCGEVESGTTTTVRRRSLTMLVERIRHGRVLLISEPNVGSSRTHHTSPRRGIVPGLRYIAGYGVEFPLDQENILILIWQVTRTSQLLILHLQFCHERLCHITGPVPRGNALEQLRRQGLWKGKGHLSGRHNAIRNQSAQCHLLWQCRTVCISCGVGNFARSRLSGGSFGRCASLRTRESPAKSRRQPGLAAPQFVQNGRCDPK